MLEQYSFLKVPVSVVQTEDAVAIVRKWAAEKDRFRYLTSTNIYNVVCAREDPHYMDVMTNADISLPEGMPLVWRGRHLGHDLPERCGIQEVMLGLFELSRAGVDYSHYFYGNTQEVLDKLRKRLLEEYPDLRISGMYSPPFRDLTDEEDNEIVEKINAAGPDFLWVSLGCPKQETWLYDHREMLNPMIGGGAGAGFNFFAGESRKASPLTQKLGLEWFVRLLSEPRRLSRRYLVKYPKSAYFLLSDISTRSRSGKDRDAD